VTTSEKERQCLLPLVHRVEGTDSSAFSYTENRVGIYLGVYPWAMALPPLGWLESGHL